MTTYYIKHPLSLPAQLQMQQKTLAIGEFDGLHRGHQTVIKKAAAIAKQHGETAAVLTFHPHPRKVLGIGGYDDMVAPLDEKIELLKRYGMELVLICEFDLDFAALSPNQFIQEVLDPLNVKNVVIGFDFTFGEKGKGTPETLITSAPHLNVHVIPRIHDQEQKISSTLIRKYLSEGQVERVSDLLDRHYNIKAKVVNGDKRGRTIGYPTANLELVSNYIVPRQGVYAVEVSVRGKTYGAMMNIGTRPTFYDHGEHPNMEVHIFDFDQNIYDEIIDVSFVSFLRKERKFASVDELIAQLALDEQAARERVNVLT